MGSLESERRHVAHEPPLLLTPPVVSGCVFTALYFHGNLRGSAPRRCHTFRAAGITAYPETTRQGSRRGTARERAIRRVALLGEHQGRRAVASPAPEPVYGTESRPSAGLLAVA